MAYKSVLDESQKRISKIKEILNNDRELVEVKSPEEYYKKTLSILKFEQKLEKPFIALLPYDERRSVGENKNSGRQQVFKDVIKEKFQKIRVYEYEKGNFLEKFKMAIRENPNHQIILATLNNNFNIRKEDLEDISMEKISLYVISLRDPYPNKILYELSSAWIDTYEVNRYTAAIGIDCLLADEKTSGKLPFDLYLRE